MPDHHPPEHDGQHLDAGLEVRLQTLAAAYAPDARPPFSTLVARSRRRRRSQAVGALLAVALAAGVPTVLLPALRARGDAAGQTLAAGASEGSGLCDDAARRYAAWLAADAGRLDLRRLERTEPSASYVPGVATLQAARQEADRIVAGTVTDVRFDAAGGSRLTLRVDRTVKGPRAAEIVVSGDNQLLPPHQRPVGPVKGPAGVTFDPTVVTVPAMLSIYPPAPLLLPGQRAVWLLQTDDAGVLTVQPTTGQYTSCRGRTTATDGNAFAAQVDGLREDQLLARLGD